MAKRKVKSNVRRKVSSKKTSKKDDFSNKTIALVLVLVIVASVFSLGVYVYYLNQAQDLFGFGGQSGNSQTGKVYLKVVEPSGEVPSAVGSAKVSLKVVEPPQT